MSTVVPWDYLIVTASNEAQAQAYESQLALRRQSGFPAHVREVLVVADPEGRRVGSGGSTIFCLMQVINRELASPSAQKPCSSRRQSAHFSSRAAQSRLTSAAPVEKKHETLQPDFSTIASILRRLRILIVHAGGDSRRLPAYGPCGKLFIPVPGKSDSNLGVTLFDRLVPQFLQLPSGPPNQGQVVMAAGDALILFDASNVSFDYTGLTALACPATPDHASKHGVFCPDAQGQVRLYLQKPRPEQQQQFGAVNSRGQSWLDIGIMSFDSTMAMALLQSFGMQLVPEGKLDWSPAMKNEVLEHGVDFYREICCALGTQVTALHHRQQAHSSGSSWTDASLAQMFGGLTGIPFHLQTVPECRFLHFGTTRQLITSGTELRQYDEEMAARDAVEPTPILRGTAPQSQTTELILDLNNEILPGGEILGASSWVEGCRITAPLQLAGQNVLVGVNVTEPLSLPQGACLDVLPGKSRQGEQVWFIRCYGIGDTFKDSLGKGATFCRQSLMDWLAKVGAAPQAVWDLSVPVEQRSLWNARVFPAARENEHYRQWLWLYQPEKASAQQKQSFLMADRYSAAEIAVASDHESFFARRRQIRTENLLF